MGSHPRASASDRKRVRPVLVSEVARIRQTCQDVIVRQAGIVGKDVIFRLARSEQVQDELDRQPGPADNGLTRQYAGIDHDAIRPGHALIIPVDGLPIGG